MALDLAALTALLSDDRPSGPDLADHADRQQIESAFERGGADDDHEQDIDWPATIRLITTQAEKTRDLWLPVYLMRAAARAGELDLLVDGAELLASLLEQRWPDVHPGLEEYGYIARKMACESLTRIGDFLRPLASIPLIRHPRLGSYSGADFLRFADEGSQAENYGMFRALIDGTPQEELQQVVNRLDALRQAIRRADSVLTERADGDTGTNFQPTYEAIERLRRSVSKHLPVDEAASDGQSGGARVAAGSQDQSQSAASAASFTGNVRSREDVARALDAINHYYSQYEPSSPVPLVLRRAREWISLDFMSVLQDIAPGSIDEAQRVLKGPVTESAWASD